MNALPHVRRQRVATAADLDPDNASILVCGGGGVALAVTRRLKDMGSWVWQLQRSDSRRKEIESMMAIVAKGDALNTEDLERVFSSACSPIGSMFCCSCILQVCIAALDVRPGPCRALSELISWCVL